jgi:hypothetical protein
LHAMNKMKCCEYSPRGRIHKTVFSSQLNNNPNTLTLY